MTFFERVRSAVRTTLIVGALSGAIGTPIYSYFWPDTVETKINDVQVKRSGGSDRYLIFTDYGVFQNKAAWYRGKFDLDAMQNEVAKLIGQKARITKYGWNMPGGLMRENIVGIETAE